MSLTNDDPNTAIQTLPVIQVEEESISYPTRDEEDENGETLPRPNLDVDCEQSYQSGESTESKRRLIIPLPPQSPVSNSSESPLSTSDSECSPTIKFLDPAQLPSPRAIHALKMDHPPLMVLSDNDREPWSRYQQSQHHGERDYNRSHIYTPRTSRLSWGNPRSIASSVENYSRSGLSHHRRGYEEIDGSFDDPDSSRCCRCFKRVGIVIGALSAALLITAVPSVILSQQMFGLENEDAFQMFIARPEVAFPTWVALSLILVFFFYILFFSVRKLRQKYLDRVASLEEAVQFARETMPEYGARVPAHHHVRLGFLDLVRQTGNSPP